MRDLMINELLMSGVDCSTEDLSVIKSMFAWIQSTMELNPDAGMITAAREYCQMHDLEYSNDVEDLVINHFHTERFTA